MVSELREDGVLTTFLADSEPPSTYLLFQRLIQPLEPDDDDTELYIERDDQLYSGYGGLETAILRDHELQLVASDGRNPALGTGLTVTLALDRAALERLDDLLREVLPNSVKFLDERRR